MAPVGEEELAEGSAQLAGRQVRTKTNGQVTQGSVCPAILCKLPEALAANILSHLRARDLAQMAAVAQCLRVRSCDVRVWMELCVSRWPTTASPALHTVLARHGARSFYRSRLVAERPQVNPAIPAVPINLDDCLLTLDIWINDPACIRLCTRLDQFSEETSNAIMGLVCRASALTCVRSRLSSQR